MVEDFRPVNLVRDPYNFSYDRNSLSESPIEIKKDDGKTYKRLIFNNGITADIPKQPKNSKAAIFSYEHKDAFGGSYTDTDASRIKGGFFKGTKKTDYFQLYGNEGSKIDITGDQGGSDNVTMKDAVKGESYGPNGMYKQEEDVQSKGNEVNMDAEDVVDLEGHKNYNGITGAAGTVAENSYPDNEPPEAKEPAKQTPAEGDNPDIAKGAQGTGSDIAAINKDKK